MDAAWIAANQSVDRRSPARDAAAKDAAAETGSVDRDAGGTGRDDGPDRGRAAGRVKVGTLCPPGNGGLWADQNRPWEMEFAMEIVTSRFGILEVDDQRIVTFTKGLLGFPGKSRFALIQTNEENYFFWLQSLDEPSLAFVVTDPSTFFKDYEVPLREETQLELELEDAVTTQVLVICNKIGDWLTGNLLGPLVLNVANQLATQVVLTDKKWTTRQPLLKLQAEPLAKAG